VLQSEILRIAEKEGVPPDTIDKDWVLGHFLAGLYRNNWAHDNLVFKGGTCLRKCYFPDYRFSEDLDFTLRDTNLQITSKILQSTCEAVMAQTGIRFSQSKIEPVTWKDRQVGYISVIQFWGANHQKVHQPPDTKRWLTKIKIEITHYEKIINDPVLRPLLSNYSDSKLFQQIRIPCYSLAEIISEKFRALLQRSYPAPRDYYDLWKLLQQTEQKSWELILSTFKQKIVFKNIFFKNYEDFFNEEQIKKMKRAWDNSLQNVLREKELPDVQEVIDELNEFCHKMSWKQVFNEM